MQKFYVVRLCEHYDGFAEYSSADYLKSFDNANDAYDYLDMCVAEEPYNKFIVRRI